MIQIYPTKKQRKILTDWRHTNRYVYNKSLAYIKNNGNNTINFQSLRNKLVTNTVKDNDGNKIQNPLVNHWETKTPKEIRAYSVKDVVTSFKSAFSNFKNGNITNFKLGFRKKKQTTSSFTVQKQSIKYKNNQFLIYNTFFGGDGFTIGKRTIKKLPKDFEVDKDSKIVYKQGKYYLSIPEEIDKKNPTKKVKKKETIALDPGVRTFMTGYSIEEVIECSRDRTLFTKLKKKISTLQENRKYKTIQKYYDRISNLVDDLHWKTINYLISNYNTILLPSFENQEMVKKSKNGKMKEALLNLKHYQFKMRLIFKSNERGNTKVFIVSEAYTSKTCGKCGTLNNNLGSSKVFKCGDCGLIMDRDYNGARNILLKHLKQN